MARMQARRGGLSSTPADDLLSTLFKATFAKTSVPAEDVGDVVIGSVLGPSQVRANEARIAMFLAGMPETVPVHTVNRCARPAGFWQHVWRKVAGVRGLQAQKAPLLCDR